MTFGPGLVARGSRERLAPILMTALTTGLALVPLLLSGDIPGQEIEYPMAIVILGGLVASTLLNLFVLPSLYLRFGKGRGFGLGRRRAGGCGVLMSTRRFRAVPLVAALMLAGVACESVAASGPSSPPATSSPVPAAPAQTLPEPIGAQDFDPDDFSDPTTIDNPYFPLRPGTRFAWKGHALDDGERIEPRRRLHGHGSDQGDRRCSHRRDLGPGLHRRRAGGDRARVLRPGRRRERLASRGVPRGVRRAEDREDAHVDRRLPGRAAGHHHAGGTRNRDPQLRRGLGAGHPLERSREGGCDRNHHVRPRGLLRGRRGDRRVQPGRARRASAQVLRRPAWEGYGSAGAARTRRSRRSWSSWHSSSSAPTRWRRFAGTCWSRRRAPTSSARSTAGRRRSSRRQDRRVRRSSRPL